MEQAQFIYTLVVEIVESLKAFEFRENPIIMASEPPPQRVVSVRVSSGRLTWTGMELLVFKSPVISHPKSSTRSSMITLGFCWQTLQISLLEIT